jgi:hypothetical protein
MTPFVETLVRGAALVRLFPSVDYNQARINAYYSHEAQRRRVPFDLALIRRVSFEKFLGMGLLVFFCLASVVASALLADYSEMLALTFALSPVSGTLWVHWLYRRLP